MFPALMLAHYLSAAYLQIGWMSYHREKKEEEEEKKLR